jgi:hypothetical protein
VPLYGDAVSGPDRQGPGTMDGAVEACSERVCDHVRRSLAGIGNLLMEIRRNTVSEIDPEVSTEPRAIQSADSSYLDGIETEHGRRAHYWDAHMTSPFNVANHCAVISVPSGQSSAGIPTGVQVVGHPLDEASVFDTALAIERSAVATAWPCEGLSSVN